MEEWESGCHFKYMRSQNNSRNILKSYYCLQLDVCFSEMKMFVYKQSSSVYVGFLKKQIIKPSTRDLIDFI